VDVRTSAGQDGDAVNTSENDGLVVLAVDDEEPALMELAYLLEQDQRVGTVLRASDAIAALRILTGGDRVELGGFGGGTPPTGLPAPAKQSDVDVLFLDIRMPGLDGLELANVLSRYVIPPSVVFVTAHDDRAVEAFDVGAVDYLLKPLRPERLYASLSRILSSRGTTVPVEPAADEEGDDEVIPVELAGTTKLVQRSTVRWVEAQGDYARLHTTEGSHLVRIPLSVLEDRWRDAGFVRIHRSFLVSLPLVTELRLSGSGYVVRVGSGPDCAELPVSRRHTRELKDRLVRATKQAWSQR
jgi:two-component system, LytTR family, response regulator LytT